MSASFQVPEIEETKQISNTLIFHKRERPKKKLRKMRKNQQRRLKETMSERRKPQERSNV